MGLELEGSWLVRLNKGKRNPNVVAESARGLQQVNNDPLEVDLGDLGLKTGQIGRTNRVGEINRVTNGEFIPLGVEKNVTPILNGVAKVVEISVSLTLADAGDERSDQEREVGRFGHRDRMVDVL